MPQLGKVRPSLLESVVFRNLGAKRKEVLVGPQFGVDNAIVRIGNGQVMAITADPLSAIPNLGLEDSAWLSVHLLASDITTSGFPPRYAVLDFNLPPQMTDNEFEIYWRSFEMELGNLGAMVVGGHTGRFEGCDYTIIGGGTIMATGPEKQYLSSNMARVGDRLITTKSAGLAAGAILSRTFPETVERAYGTRFLHRAQMLFRKITTVRDALSLTSIGVRDQGVTAMHDATEGGVMGGLYEMLSASRVGALIRKDTIPVSVEIAQLCELFGIDPYTSLSEGTLIASVRPDRTNDALKILRRKGFGASEIGEVLPRRNRIQLEHAGRRLRLKYPRGDPYWGAYWRSVKAGLR